MKTIIAGSRGVANYDLVLGVVCDSGFVITEIVSGGALGVDRVGEQIAEAYSIPVVRFIPDWNNPRLGKGAGHVRNRDMALYADALIAIWDGHSPGTRNMIDTAKRLGLLVHIGIV